MRSDAILDTSIVIDYLRGMEAALACVERLERPPTVAAVTLTEVFAGLRGRREEGFARTFFADVKVAPVGPEIAERAGAFLRHYRPSHGIDLADALIAATAEHHGLSVATLNVRHFPMFRGLRPAY